MSTPDAVLVLTTTGNDDSAASLSRALVEEGLAACVSRIPVRSTYYWEGKLTDEGEVLLVIKTARRKLAQLETRLLELHTYECPEFVVLEPAHIETRYLDWLLAACS